MQKWGRGSCRWEEEEEEEDEESLARSKSTTWLAATTWVMTYRRRSRGRGGELEQQRHCWENELNGPTTKQRGGWSIYETQWIWTRWEKQHSTSSTTLEEVVTLGDASSERRSIDVDVDINDDSIDSNRRQRQQQQQQQRCGGVAGLNALQWFPIPSTAYAGMAWHGMFASPPLPAAATCICMPYCHCHPQAFSLSLSLSTHTMHPSLDRFLCCVRFAWRQWLARSSAVWCVVCRQWLASKEPASLCTTSSLTTTTTTNVFWILIISDELCCCSS